MKFFYIYIVITLLLVSLPGISRAQDEPTIRTYLHIDGVTNPSLPDGSTVEVYAKVKAVDGHLVKGSNISVNYFEPGYEYPQTDKTGLFGLVKYLSPTVLQFRVFAEWTNSKGDQATTHFLCTATIGSEEASCTVTTDEYGPLEGTYIMHATTGPITPET